MTGIEIQGLFVKRTARSRGIGKALLDHAKKQRSSLRLSVYEKNQRAFYFYQREGFQIRKKTVDGDTGEAEYEMEWDSVPKAEKVLKVRFYDQVEDEKLKFAVLIAKKDGKWVLCRHKERKTYELPGGHREPGEKIEETARRELWEETGAARFELSPVCAYSVLGRTKEGGEQENFGMLFAAEIFFFDERVKPGKDGENSLFLAGIESEMEQIVLVDEPTLPLTYPDIMPHLIREAEKRGTGGNHDD